MGRRKEALAPGGLAKEPPFAFEPLSYSISWRTVRDALEGESAAGANGAPDVVEGPVLALRVEGCQTYVTQDFSVAVRRGGDWLSFELVPLVPLKVDSFVVEIAHDFVLGERVLMNGYQSWTTTAELPAEATMRGLAGVPKPVVDTYALDGIGDYRFTEYRRRLGNQHGFTYGVFRRGNRRFLVGSLDESRGLTLLRSDFREGRVTLEPECPKRVLPVGEPLMLGSFALVEGDEGQIYDRWFELSGIGARPVRPLVGYSSWYRHYGDIDETRLDADLAGARQALGELGVLDSPGDGATCVFQVDDGFCRVGDWLEPDEGKFPQGMRALASRIREAGFLPGLWLAPFVCEKDSRLFSAHGDWLLRDGQGRLVRTGPHWSGAYALDTRNPAVRAYVADVVRTVVREWGFGLLKLDFLYAACMLEHDGLNRGELMADALDLLREAAGENTLMLGCGVPLGPAFGRLDYCRIGCDVGLDWDDKPYMRLLHRERVSTRNSLGNTIARAPLDGRAFGNDPDVFFLRGDVSLTSRRRRRLLRADAVNGSMLLTSDDMGAWGTAERELFQEALRMLLDRRP